MTRGRRTGGTIRHCSALPPSPPPSEACWEGVSRVAQCFRLPFGHCCHQASSKRPLVASDSGSTRVASPGWQVRSKKFSVRCATGEVEQREVILRKWTRPDLVLRVSDSRTIRRPFACLGLLYPASSSSTQESMCAVSLPLAPVWAIATATEAKCSKRWPGKPDYRVRRPSGRETLDADGIGPAGRSERQLNGVSTHPWYSLYGRTCPSIAAAPLAEPRSYSVREVGLSVRSPFGFGRRERVPVHVARPVARTRLPFPSPPRPTSRFF